MVTLHGLTSIIGAQDEFEVVHSERDIDVSLSALAEHRPDVYVIESCFGGDCVLETVVRAACPVPVLIVSRHRSALVLQRAMRHGARGYIPLEARPSMLGEAMLRIVSGSVYLDPGLGAELAERRGIHTLSERELDVLHLVAIGHTTAEIAASLYVSERTVEACRSSLKSKLGLRTKAQIHAYAWNKGLITACSCVPVPGAG
ncbi:response regulator transcription factor [Glycomyces sp. TRM65418]|uniref:response regulator transcription factor n=1 Tax=Glycomyces sp. TRM65418 TaxID=2867006 RepID=UPI001CE58D96|nr:response regulator transcription factor [Glycomyces sp. TRM65418]MCC3765514.1 response regulator transcription factor [Glycomyces sp. TRM65418]QZD55121.1 response regulator transcription factor [Glycomyces sp. TRM65418]